MYVNIVFAEYFIYVSACTTKLVSKPRYCMPLLSKALLDEFSYVHHDNIE